MYIKMLIFADSLFVESVTVKFRKYGEISVLYPVSYTHLTLPTIA